MSDNKITLAEKCAVSGMAIAVIVFVSLMAYVLVGGVI